MITDFEAITSGAIYGALIEIKDCPGIAGSQGNGIALSEITLLESRPRLFYMGVYTGKEDADLRSIKPSIHIDGHD